MVEKTFKVSDKCLVSQNKYGIFSSDETSSEAEQNCFLMQLQKHSLGT